MSTVLADLAELSAHELQEKTAALEVVRAHLQAATRELGARRRRAAEAQRDAAVREETGMRTNNLWRMLYAEMGWGAPAAAGAVDIHAQERDALARSSIDEEMQLDQVDVMGWPFDGEAKDEQEQLVRLRWLKSYYEKSTATLEERIGSLDGESVVKQRQCRKVVAMCCNVPEDHVEDVSVPSCVRLPLMLMLVQILDDLVTAIESDRMGVDLARLAGFLQQVKRTPQAGGGSAAAPARQNHHSEP